jgi:predicted nucleic acid-binding protein
VSTSSLVLDTGGWLLALAGVRQYAEAVRRASRCIVPGLVLAEVDWHLRAKRTQMRRLMQELAAGAYQYEAPTGVDLARAMQIDKKFSELELGLVDASVAALAERTGVHHVLTTDSDFLVLRIGPRWNTALELVVPLRARS